MNVYVRRKYWKSTADNPLEMIVYWHLCRALISYQTIIKMTLHSTWKPWSHLYFVRLASILTINHVLNYPMTQFDLKHVFLRNKTGYWRRNFLTKTWSPPRTKFDKCGPMHILHHDSVYYCNFRDPTVRERDQFIIHCSESQQRLYLIEFVLYFPAGCLHAMEVLEILSTAIPALRGGGG